MQKTFAQLLAFFVLISIMVSARAAEIEDSVGAALDVKSDRVLVEPEDVNTKDGKWNALEMAKPMKAAPPPPPPRKYSGAFAADLGLVTRRNNVDEAFTYLLGLQYRSSSLHPGHWEVGFDIIGDRMGSLAVGYRYIFDHDRKVRPQVKLAWVSTPPTGAGVEQIFSLSNQKARLSVGLEHFFRETISFRIEGEYEIEKNPNVVRFKFGLIWSFESVPGKLRE